MVLMLGKTTTINNILIECTKIPCNESCPEGDPSRDCVWYNPRENGGNRLNVLSSDHCCTRMKLREYLTGSKYTDGEGYIYTTDLEEAYAVVNSLLSKLDQKCNKHCHECKFHRGMCQRMNIHNLIKMQNDILQW